MDQVAFADLMLAVSNVSINDPKKVHHAGIRQRHSWAMTGRGKPLQKMLDGGKAIQFTTRLRNKGSLRTYADNTPLTAAKTQTLTNGEVQWCQVVAEKSWDDKTIILGGGGSEYSEAHRKVKFIDLATNLEAGLQVDIAEGVEDKWMATPDKTTQEGTGATEIVPMAAWINDHFGASGSAMHGNFYNPTTGAWTSQGGISNLDPSKTRWRNRIGAYSSAAAKPSSGALNVVNAFDDMWHQLRYVPPPPGSLGGGGGANGADPWEIDQWPHIMSWTSRRGVGIMQDLIRQQGDRWTQANNPDAAVGGYLGGPMYAGCEHLYIPALDTATFYLDSYTSPTALTNQFAGEGKGPRYFLPNLTTIGFKFHQDKHFKRTDARTYDHQPFDYTVWVDCYLNTLCEARWLNAVIAPGTVAGEFPSQVYTPTSVYTS